MKTVIVEGHNLILEPGKMSAKCGCGEPFKGKTISAMTKQWSEHVASFGLLAAVVDAVKREYAAREEGERLIQELMAAGVSPRKVSDAIGTQSNGKPIMSATSIMRIGRERINNPDKPPRRRKAPVRNGRSSQAKRPGAKKTAAKKTTVKKATAKKALVSVPDAS